MNKIRIIIADDHSIVREGLKQLLELEEDFEVVGQASNGAETIERVKELKPDVLLLDINMPTMNGIKALKKLKEEGIDTRVVILTIHEDREYLLETMQIGASGYILKDSDSASFFKAIRDAYNGESYIQPKLAADLIREFNKPKLARVKNENELTQREYEVITLIADGMNNKDIADKLFISEKTVKNHVSNIFRKINVSDRTQAAIYAYKNNIIK
ncbi:MAG TPA: response regulator transcription factor [Bacillota bacterium]|nr:response regulator transcription factor [Bacillota bacterium]HPL53087.1 response regulator transcription factor [Bacillota bacterium]